MNNNLLFFPIIFYLIGLNQSLFSSIFSNSWVSWLIFGIGITSYTITYFYFTKELKEGERK